MDIFKNEFGITCPDEIYMGGIIIGSERTHVKDTLGVYNETYKQWLYRKALGVRLNNFYKCCGIKLYTWNAILELLHKPPIVGGHTEGSMQPLNSVMPQGMHVEKGFL